MDGCLSPGRKRLLPKRRDTAALPHSPTPPCCSPHQDSPLVPHDPQVILMDHLDWLSQEQHEEYARVLAQQVPAGGIVIWRSAALVPSYTAIIARAGFDVRCVSRVDKGYMDRCAWCEGWGGCAGVGRLGGHWAQPGVQMVSSSAAHQLQAGILKALKALGLGRLRQLEASAVIRIPLAHHAALLTLTRCTSAAPAWPDRRVNMYSSFYVATRTEASSKLN